MGQTDQKRTYQSRTAGDTDQIHVVDGDPGLIQCLLIDTIDVAQMMTRCDFRHHASEHLVHGDLRRYDIGEHRSPVCNDGDGRFVAAAFDAHGDEFSVFHWLPHVEEMLVHAENAATVRSHVPAVFAGLVIGHVEHAHIAATGKPTAMRC